MSPETDVSLPPRSADVFCNLITPCAGGICPFSRLQGLVSHCRRSGRRRGNCRCWYCTADPGRRTTIWSPSRPSLRRGGAVIFYDQLGCGLSDQPHDPEMWTVDLFVEELGVVRQALGLDHTHILGQSWGGMLAMQYALTQPQGVASLVIANSPASMAQWVSEANRLRADLPPEVQQTLLQHEAAGTTDDPAYLTAMQVFYDRHVCRVVPAPEYVARSFAQIERNPEVYHTMNGPSEFHCIGKIKDWDIVDRLGEINIPALVISGRYDEATPLIAETVHNGIRGIGMGSVRGEFAHAPRRGDGALHTGGGGISGPHRGQPLITQSRL